MKKLNTETFVTRVRLLNNKFDYSRSEYVNSRTKVEIICAQHGSFWQLPLVHLNQNQGCPKCYFVDANEFLDRAGELHENKYDYSIAVYKGTKTKLEIICKIHGPFWQTPSKHISCKQGCPKCNPSHKQTLDRFISRANLVHENCYDYSKSIYVNRRIKIEIICKTHGAFWQRPGDHIDDKNGCPRCSYTISIPETSWLDELGIPKENRNRTLKLNGRKFNVDGLVGHTIYEFYGDFYHGNPKKFVPSQVNKKLKKTFGELYKQTLAREQELINAKYNLITIWESDFKNQGAK